ncbi:MAG TPA: hypothetical protein VKQ36_12285, partial [Ktedonobacterales bacterium]|nr:hypothetical protein [Ktedonobacterales bacterium]
PKAEPFKRWLARVGTERIQEEAEPTLAEERLMRLYRRQGYTDPWIRQRMQSIRYRNGVTAEWGARGAETGQDFALLTDTISVGKFGITTGEHKEIKGLEPGDNLENSETIMELAITALADATAITLHQARDSQGFDRLQVDCQDAGRVAGDARRQVESLTGEPVVSPVNYKQLRRERQRELQPPLFPDEDDPGKPAGPEDK